MHSKVIWSYVYMCLCMLSCFSRAQLFVTLWTAARQAPLSMGILQARTLEWVAMPTSRGSSQPRDWTQVFHIVSRFFTNWATREAQEYWSGQPIPSLGDLPDLGIEPVSPAFQAVSLPAGATRELSKFVSLPLLYYIFLKVGLKQTSLNLLG